MNKGILYGVGVGPGDPELMTLKAVRTIREADVIAMPSSGHGSRTAFHIASGAVPELWEKALCTLTFPMTRNRSVREESCQKNADLLLSFLKNGSSVAFLVLGDPSIYSTYTYVSRLVADAGFETVTIPGVPSFCAAAASLGCSLGEDDEQIHILPASYPLNESLSLPGKKILMKSGRRIGEIRDELLARDIPAVMAENCGMEGEKTYLRVDDFPDEASYYSLLILD